MARGVTMSAREKYKSLIDDCIDKKISDAKDSIQDEDPVVEIYARSLGVDSAYKRVLEINKLLEELEEERDELRREINEAMGGNAYWRYAEDNLKTKAKKSTGECKRLCDIKEQLANKIYTAKSYDELIDLFEQAQAA